MRWDVAFATISHQYLYECKPSMAHSAHYSKFSWALSAVNYHTHIYRNSSAKSKELYAQFVRTFSSFDINFMLFKIFQDFISFFFFCFWYEKKKEYLCSTVKQCDKPLSKIAYFRSEYILRICLEFYTWICFN